MEIVNVGECVLSTIDCMTLMFALAEFLLVSTD